MKITDIQPQKKRIGYYNVFIDEEFWCSVSDSDLVRLGLHLRQQFTPAEAEALKDEAGLSKLYNKVLNFLSYRPRSQKEVEDYLRKKEATPEQIEALIARLEREHYVDDVDFATLWVDNRNRLRPRSTAMLRAELMQKGIARDTIDEVLANQADNQISNIAREVAKKQKSNPKIEKQALLAQLTRKGYKYSDIALVLDSVSFDEPLDEH